MNVTNLAIDDYMQAGGQYGSVQQILQALDEIVHIWHKPQKKFLSLCMLQEYTRQASSAFRQSMSSENSHDMKRGIAQFVSTLLRKIDEIFVSEFETPPSNLANYWHPLLAAFHRGPPKIDRGYYFYGLLDCTAQLAAFVHPDILPVRLLRSLTQLIKQHRMAEFRWKAVSYVLYKVETKF